MYKVEKNIPVPKGYGSNRRGKYPWREMEVGDSFFIPGTECTEGKARSAPSYFALRNPGYKFTVQKVEGGYRIWRIECEKES